MGEPADSDLRRRLMSGDPAAQRVLFDLHYDEVRAYLARCEVRGRNEADADEITAETFHRALRGLGGFDGRASLRTCLLRLARHAAVDYYRLRRHRPWDGRGPGEDVASLGDPARNLVLEETRRRVRKHLESLDPDHRRVVALRVSGGLSTRETAEVMERSEAAVKMLLLRATRRLADLLRADPYFARQSQESGKG